MRDKVGFISAGQCGGNIGLVLEKAGYDVLHLNASPEDLATLAGARHVHHIRGGEGCGKDRGRAKELLMDDFDAISEKVRQALPHEHVFVVFAAGWRLGEGRRGMSLDAPTAALFEVAGNVHDNPELLEGGGAG